MMDKLIEKCKYGIAFAFFALRSLLEPRKINVRNIDETIDKLIQSNKSLIRFGDGEIALIRGFDIRFQHYSEDLAKELLQALKQNDVMVAIPDILYWDSIKQYKKEDRKAWIYESMFSYPIYRKYCKQKEYYNSLVSRLYLPFDCQYETVQRRFLRIKQLWDGKKVLIVEGEYSRLGVGNDLFYNVQSIDRILCPSKDSYEFIDEIEKEIISAHKMKSYDLTILAIGPTAKVLVSRLNKMGRFIDLGHIDIEYEWFLRKVNEKTAISGKAVNEVPDGYNYIENKDSKYQQEVIARINASRK